MRLVFIVGIGGGQSAFLSEERPLDHSTGMGEWPGLFQWIKDGRGGSTENKERGVLCCLSGMEKLNC